MNRRDSGFGVAGVILLIAALLALGGVGFYTYHKQHKEQLKMTDSGAKTEPAVSSHKATTKTAETLKNYLEIKEWNVKAEANPDFALKYRVSDKNHNLVKFDTDQLAKADARCSVGAAGFMKRLKPDELVNAPEISSYTAEQFATEPQYKEYRSYIAKLGSYYYYFQSNQGPCGDVGDLQEQSQEAAKKLLQTLQQL